MSVVRWQVGRATSSVVAAAIARDVVDVVVVAA